MSDIDALQSRILAAMDRIGSGIDALEPAASGADPGEIEVLRSALEEEKLANAQLSERINKLKSDHAAELEAAQSAAVPPVPAVDPERLAALDTELQRLRKANDQLRASNASLREANEAGVGEPQLINAAVLAELEALRASRAAETAEANAIMDQLVPLLDGARSQTEGEES